MKLREIYLVVRIFDDGERVPLRAYSDKTYADRDVQMLKEIGELYEANYTAVPIELFDGILETDNNNTHIVVCSTGK